MSPLFAHGATERSWFWELAIVPSAYGVGAWPLIAWVAVWPLLSDVCWRFGIGFLVDGCLCGRLFLLS